MKGYLINIAITFITTIIIITLLVACKLWKEMPKEEKEFFMDDDEE